MIKVTNWAETYTLGIAISAGFAAICGFINWAFHKVDRSLEKHGARLEEMNLKLDRAATKEELDKKVLPLEMELRSHDRRLLTLELKNEKDEKKYQ